MMNTTTIATKSNIWTILPLIALAAILVTAPAVHAADEFPIPGPDDTFGDPVVDQFFEALEDGTLPQEAYIRYYSRHEEDRINRCLDHIASVNDEGVEEGLRKLESVDGYYESHLGATIPPHSEGESLDAIVGSMQTKQIKHCRRFRKLHADLGALPKEKTTALVAAEIESALPEYIELWNELVTIMTEDEPKPERARFFRVQDNEDGTPTLRGLQLKLLSLVWLAGDLELDGARPVVDRVIEEALAQRKWAYTYDVGERPWRDAAYVIAHVSIYNRPILGTAVVLLDDDVTVDHVLARREGDNSYCEGMCMIEETMAAFNAIGFSGTPDLPVDWSQGTIEVRMMPSLTDAEFDAILSQAGGDATQ